MRIPIFQDFTLTCRHVGFFHKVFHNITNPKTGKPLGLRSRGSCRTRAACVRMAELRHRQDLWRGCFKRSLVLGGKRPRRVLHAAAVVMIDFSDCRSSRRGSFPSQRHSTRGSSESSQRLFVFLQSNISSQETRALQTLTLPKPRKKTNELARKNSVAFPPLRSMSQPVGISNANYSQSDITCKTYWGSQGEALRWNMNIQILTASFP